MKKFIDKYSCLIKHLFKFKKTFVILVLYSGMQSFFTVGAGALGSFMISEAILKIVDINTLYKQLLLLIVLVIGKGIFAYLEMFEVHVFAYEILFSIRKDMYDAIERGCPFYTERYRTGEISSIVMEDVESMELLLAHILPSYVAAFISSIVFFVILSRFSGILAIVAIIATPLIVAVPFTFRKFGNGTGEKIRKQMAVIAAGTIDILQGMPEILSFNRKKFYLNKLVENTEKLNKLRLRDGVRIGFHNAAINLIMSVMIAVALMTSHYSIVTGKMDVVYLPIVLSLAFSIFGPAIGVSNTASKIPELLSSMERVEKVLEMKTVREDKDLQESLKPGSLNNDSAIKVENLTFFYNKGKKILTGLNLDVKRGEFVAITGASGVGKSTLANLIMGYYFSNDGNISVFGNSYKNIMDKVIRDNISYIPQDTYLFHGNFIDNIKIAKPDASDEEVKSAAKAALAHDFIINSDNGYESRVGERGLTLSGGERQRISIARAILKNAPIILMDEAVSNLDIVNEKLFYEALKNLRSKTIIMIAHRASSLRYADRILKLEEGKLKEIRCS